MRDGIEEETGNGDERYLTKGNGNPRLCDRTHQRNLWNLWIFVD